MWRDDEYIRRIEVRVYLPSMYNILFIRIIIRLLNKL